MSEPFFCVINAKKTPVDIHSTISDGAVKQVKFSPFSTYCIFAKTAAVCLRNLRQK